MKSLRFFGPIRLEKPVLKKKHFPSFFAGPGPGPAPRAKARAPAKKDGKFKFTARKLAQNHTKASKKSKKSRKTREKINE